MELRNGDEHLTMGRRANSLGAVRSIDEALADYKRDHEGER